MSLFLYRATKTQMGRSARVGGALCCSISATTQRCCMECANGEGTSNETIPSRHSSDPKMLGNPGALRRRYLMASASRRIRPALAGSLCLLAMLAPTAWPPASPRSHNPPRFLWELIPSPSGPRISRRNQRRHRSLLPPAFPRSPARCRGQGAGRTGNAGARGGRGTRARTPREAA